MVSLNVHNIGSGVILWLFCTHVVYTIHVANLLQIFFIDVGFTLYQKIAIWWTLSLKYNMVKISNITKKILKKMCTYGSASIDLSLAT